MAGIVPFIIIVAIWVFTVSAGKKLSDDGSHKPAAKAGQQKTIIEAKKQLQMVQKQVRRHRLDRDDDYDDDYDDEESPKSFVRAINESPTHEKTHSHEGEVEGLLAITEDRKNDWLARQIRAEARTKKMMM